MPKQDIPYGKTRVYKLKQQNQSCKYTADKDEKYHALTDQAGVTVQLYLHTVLLSYSSFAHDVILSHWAPSWLILQITLAVYSEIVVSIYYFIVSLSLL